MDPGGVTVWVYYVLYLGLFCIGIYLLFLFENNKNVVGYVIIVCFFDNTFNQMNGQDRFKLNKCSFFCNKIKCKWKYYIKTTLAMPIIFEN